MTLDEHGGACRCLLRLRENQGLPGLSDTAFINRFLPRYPEWRQRPGAAEISAVVDIARELGLASRAETFRAYDRVLEEHRAGRDVLVETQRVPEQLEKVAPGRHVMLLVEMTEDNFVVWCPFVSGLSDTLPRAPRIWWDRWEASGVVLYPTAPAVAR